MKIGILETGRPPGCLADEFGDYPAMFERLLGEDFKVESYDVEAGRLPAHPDAHGAFLITGSPAGVYEPLPWIQPLEQFIREARQARLVGICFGHQIMAQALGGEVEKSDKGWGAGLHRYSIRRSQPWMNGDAAGEIAAPASHQDQVVIQPPATTVIASSGFTPYAVLRGRIGRRFRSSSIPNSRRNSPRRSSRNGTTSCLTLTQRSHRWMRQTTMSVSRLGYEASSRHRSATITGDHP